MYNTYDSPSETERMSAWEDVHLYDGLRYSPSRSERNGINGCQNIDGKNDYYNEFFDLEKNDLLKL